MEDDGSESTSLTMPEGDVGVVASYEDNPFPVETYGEHFDPQWADAEPGLIRDLDYGSIEDWPEINGDEEKIVITDQETVNIEDMKGVISWDREHHKYGTTFIHIRNCEEVILEDLHFLQEDPDWVTSHAIFVEDSGRVVLKNSSFHGAVKKYHVRMEGNREVIIDNVEVAGYDYGDDIIRTGGGLWIENGNEARGEEGLQSIRSPNPRDLEWFQITNSYIHDSHSNPDRHNHDGILVHSGSNSLIYDNLIKNWTARDAGLDVSHRRTDNDYNHNMIHIEKNEFNNIQYIKVPGFSNSDSNKILFINNSFENIQFGMYNNDYPVIFKECLFNDAFSRRFMALWGVTGQIKFENNEFIFNDLARFIAEGGAANVDDHTYLVFKDNMYYVGNVSLWLDGKEVRLSSWDDWQDFGYDNGSVYNDIEDYPERSE